MATSFYGLKSPEECNRRGERGRGHGVETLGKAKSWLWDKEKEFETEQESAFVGGK